MLLYIGILVGVLFLGIVLFMNLSPQFGRKPSAEQKKEYAKTDNHNGDNFLNIDGVTADMARGDMWKAMKGMLRSIPNTRPASPLPVQSIDSTDIAQYSGEARLVWFGHSTFLLQLQGKNILIDPMFGQVPAPHPWLDGKRFGKLPIEIKKLPQIDAVLLSHDHYDHLDHLSILLIKDKVKHFFTPLGLGNHLQRWGVSKEDITELNWSEEVNFEGLLFASTPSQHFSGRGFSDRDQTLWTSWVIQSESENIFFSGDSGYADHFKSIGEKYGPFDFALMECGQYNTLWPVVHMFPEETAQAGIDVKAKRVMPIHWGAFKLAQHTWTDPVERFKAKAEELQLEYVVPEIGQITQIKDSTLVQKEWWKD
ncbi:MBL fold metallo-hydrolase [Aureicoccus marinus]|uniref:Metallo-beta-lactamase domain-containing protein n=1 Tax=Aureicoccus marinus TaxID=754435 RepID=A0A2S7TAZ0_9FLAO|nr:MBL fold metallo-hydrolase [Aureicoccus marinus]PQJ16741.1 hypothetical protein BST99_02345 [Aureicoccus marinus]